MDTQEKSDMLVYEENRTIRALVQSAAREFGDYPFLRTVKGDAFLDTSFLRFREDCERIAAWAADRSRALGHRPRVAMLSPNSCAYVTLMLGVMYAGGISIPMDPQINEKTLCSCCSKAEADILIHDSSIEINVESVQKNTGVTQVLTLEDWLAQMAGYAPVREQIPVTQNDCAAILFTSGSTGEEKGVMLSNGNLTDSAFNSECIENIIRVNSLPMHHAFCLSADILRSLSACGTLCINGGMKMLAENLLRFQPSQINIVPMVAQALYNKMVMLAQQENKTPEEVKHRVIGSQIQKVTAGGAHLPAELVQKYQAIGIFLCQGYGMTEHSPIISSPILGRPDKADTAGHVVLRCKTRVVDGELQVKGPSVMMGYVNAPELTAQAITEDGWLRTGDIGYEDEEGFLHITGRLKNLIILSNGENVSPEQIENLLLDHHLVQECLVYGQGTSIVAEILPNTQYAQLNGITDIPAAVEAVVREVNSTLPSHKKVMKHLLRIVPLKKTGSNKIARNQRATPEMLLHTDTAGYRLPENELQQKLFDCVAGVLGHRDFGVDTDIFTVGLDSLGCILLLSALSDRLSLNVTLDEIMEARTVKQLEALCLGRAAGEAVDYTPRAEYPLSFVQMYFAYAMRGNTTANVPVLFQLDDSVDLVRLQKAICDLFAVHPILNDRILRTRQGYVNARQDDRPVNIPIVSVEPAQWPLIRKDLVKPYRYGPDEPLYHIELYIVGSEKYLLFDVAHIISDGASLSIMLDNMNRLYAGEAVEPEKYTFYDYILDEKYRSENQLFAPNMAYFSQLMEGMQVDRSILNLPEPEIARDNTNAALYGRFGCVSQKQVRDFCHKQGISENVFFLTAFNYCISLYSGKADTISTSIHNGRIDSRWGRVSGCLFNTYNFRCTFQPRQTVVEVLKANAKQVMQTMCCHLNSLHADEMFFQFQGELLDFPEIAGAPARKIPLQLDSLPFHLIAHSRDGAYLYELRYWENRFDTCQLNLFLEAMDHVLAALLTQTHISGLRSALPVRLFPAAGAPAVLDHQGQPQPIGAWGLDPDSGCQGRILPDGRFDALETSGRVVLLEGVISRSLVDLKQLEQVLLAFPGVADARAFVCFGEKNELLLAAEVQADGTLDQSQLLAHVKANCKRHMVPAKITCKA